ncbi:MAG: hypothetical protein QOJ65_2084, partial [Fimbriimonadaceae bacterium]|nr:hypothetical protein [Fimbriimonadaceae bacterium]
MQFSIRMAQPEDSSEAVRVVRAVYDEYGFTWDSADYHADLYDLQSHYLDHGCPFFIAELPDGGIVGTAALDIFPALPGVVGTLQEIDGRIRIAGADCSMERLYVDPAARRLGIGRALVEHLIKSGVENGCKRMEIWS